MAAHPSLPQYLEAAGAGAAAVEVVQGEGRLQPMVLALVGEVGGVVDSQAVVVVGDVLVEAKLQAALMVPRVGQRAGAARLQAPPRPPPPTVTPVEGVLLALFPLLHPRAGNTLHRPPRPRAVHGGAPASPPCPLAGGAHQRQRGRGARVCGCCVSAWPT